MTVSIIIAVKTWQKNLEECVAKCLELDYPDFEIIILPDKSLMERIPHDSNIPYKIIPTGHVTPALKRDMALDHAKGEILAFIDDDAYPHKNWLKNAAAIFEDPDVAAVGGPAITPPDDGLFEIASGVVYASRLVSGNYAYRYLPKRRILVEDYPSSNLLVRKSIMLELGGFNTKFWPGEDTKLCLDIVKTLRKKIVYDPEVLVYHHRRPLFIGHLKQISSYASHRGFFVKRYPETSLKLPYFIPSIFLLGIVLGIIPAIYSIALKEIYISILFFYLILVFIFSIAGLKDVPRALKPGQKAKLIINVFAGIILSHLYYGLYFLKGLCCLKMREEA